MHGQSLSSGLVIENGSLNRIHSLSRHGADVDAGVRWKDLVIAAAAGGLTPPVLRVHQPVDWRHPVGRRRLGPELCRGPGRSCAGARGRDRRGPPQAMLEHEHRDLFDAVRGPRTVRRHHAGEDGSGPGPADGPHLQPGLLHRDLSSLGWSFVAPMPLPRRAKDGFPRDPAGPPASRCWRRSCSKAHEADYIVRDIRYVIRALVGTATAHHAIQRGQLGRRPKRFGRGEAKCRGRDRRNTRRQVRSLAGRARPDAPRLRLRGICRVANHRCIRSEANREDGTRASQTLNVRRWPNGRSRSRPRSTSAGRSNLEADEAGPSPTCPAVPLHTRPLCVQSPRLPRTPF